MSIHNRITNKEKQIISKNNLTAQELSIILKRHKITIYRVARSINAELPKPKKQYTVQPDLFNKLNINTAYLLGFIAADGYVSVGPRNGGKVEISLSDKDMKHLKKLKRLFKTTAKISKSKTNFNTIRCRLVVCCKPLIDRLIELGITQKKSLTLKFPLITEKLQPHFIRGYFDGDGCARVCKNGFELSMLGTYDFLSEVKKIYNKNQKIPTGSLKQYGNLFRLSFSGLFSPQQFGIWLYKNSSDNNRLKRKHDIFLKILKIKCKQRYNVEINRK